MQNQTVAAGEGTKATPEFLRIMQMMQKAIAHNQRRLGWGRLPGERSDDVLEPITGNTVLPAAVLRLKDHLFGGIHTNNGAARPAPGQTFTDVAGTAPKINQAVAMGRPTISVPQQLIKALHERLVACCKIRRRVGLHLQWLIHELRLRRPLDHRVESVNFNPRVWLEKGRAMADALANRKDASMKVNAATATEADTTSS